MSNMKILVAYKLIIPLLSIFILINISLPSAFAEVPTAGLKPDKASNAFASLPNTDGFGLLPKPVDFTKEQLDNFFKEGNKACEADCVTKFGTVLGIADGVKGFSNCQSMCIHPEYTFLNLRSGKLSVHKEDPKQENLHYIGVVYQCVEYARRWWMKNKGITFGSVDGANQIIYLEEGIDIHTQETFPLARSVNGTAKRPPKRGDLIIYYPLPENPHWRWGHVAVVTDVDLNKGVVAIAEQNITNAKWESPNAYARQIRLFQVAGRYQILDIPTTENKNPNGALIAGWVYPVEGSSSKSSY